MDEISCEELQLETFYETCGLPDGGEWCINKVLVKHHNHVMQPNVRYQNNGFPAFMEYFLGNLQVRV